MSDIPFPHLSRDADSFLYFCSNKIPNKYKIGFIQQHHYVCLCGYIYISFSIPDIPFLLETLGWIFEVSFFLLCNYSVFRFVNKFK